MPDQIQDAFGTQPLGRLLRQQAVPAAAGILVMSVYGIVDTIFVGIWVGPLGIAAITVVLPCIFLIASIGMAIGVGGASIISRAFGSGDKEKAYHVFGNQVLITISLGIVAVITGLLLMDQILYLFGGHGDVAESAKVYFSIVLIGVPFLGWAIMSTNVIRAEGFPRIAMLVLIVPAVVNIVLDPLFIVYLGMGLSGAAWATSISYFTSALFSTWFFLKGQSQMRFHRIYFKPRKEINLEIASLGSVTFARQGTISLLAIILNNSLFYYGGEIALSIYGIVSRLLMFANFPVQGITQASIPLIGYNYGANLIDRVTRLIKLSIASATLISLGIFTLIMTFTPQIVSIFTNDPHLIQETTHAIRRVFLATPLLAVSLLGAAFFQALGRARPAFMLSLSKQGFLLIPLVLILPMFMGLNGIWIAFPIADVGAALLSALFLRWKFRDLSVNGE